MKAADWPERATKMTEYEAWWLSGGCVLEDIFSSTREMADSPTSTNVASGASGTGSRSPLEISGAFFLFRLPLEGTT